jgi:methionine synthase II (cobalamin-independent)
MIDKTMFIEDIVRDYPEVIAPLAEAGLACVKCGEPLWGTLEELAERKKITNLDDIIADLNQRLNSNHE